MLVIGTMRSDYLDVYEQHLESLKPPFLEPYRLPSLPWERVTEVIVKPAERVDVTFSEDLIHRLKADAPNSDALPLLAFTLEKLYRAYAVDKKLELSEYVSIGGMEGSIRHTVEQIIPANSLASDVDAVRSSFVKYLVQVNEEARSSDSPPAGKTSIPSCTQAWRNSSLSGC